MRIRNPIYIVSRDGGNVNPYLVEVRSPVGINFETFKVRVTCLLDTGFKKKK
jgi:hypothetical protein